MSKLLFCFLLLLPFQGRADLGGSLAYHGTFYFKSGAIITGYVVVGGYDAYAYLDETGRNEYCSNAGMLKMLRLAERSQRLTGYEKIYYPRYYCLPDKNGKPSPEYQLSAALASDSFSIRSAELVQVKFLDVENDRSFHPGFETFRIMTPEMLTLVRSGPYFGGYWHYADRAEIGICFLNYNPRYNEAEIERLYNTYWRSKLAVYDPSMEKYKRTKGQKVTYDADQSKRDFDAFNKAMEEMQRWFEARQVVLVFEYGTC